MGIKGKMKGCKGFSLAETMLAVLILLLVSLIVANGMPAARNAYEKVIVASNAQALLSTTANALRDELGTAWDVQKEQDTDTEKEIISYYSTNTGARSRIYKTADGAIMLDEYINVGDLIVSSNTQNRRTARLLVNPKTATESLAVTYSTVTVNNNIVTFTALNSGRPDTVSTAPLISVNVTIPVISSNVP